MLWRLFKWAFQRRKPNVKCVSGPASPNNIICDGMLPSGGEMGECMVGIQNKFICKEMLPSHGQK